MFPFESSGIPRYGIHVRAVIYCLLSSGSTADGVATLSMELQDSDGALMKFVALGSIADGKDFTVGNELIIFFREGHAWKREGSSGGVVDL